MASMASITYLCKLYGIRPDQRSGQNFLIDQSALNAVVRASDLKSDDIVLEIGPGFGTLTAELAKSAKKVLAVEMDRRFIPALVKLANVYKSVSVHEGDIFRIWPTLTHELGDRQYKIVANLPYNITSLVLRNFLEKAPRPARMVVMVQEEVAERVTAKPGEFSLLTLAVQIYGKPELIATVSRKCFWPEPKVDSAVLSISRIGSDPAGVIKELGKEGTEKLWQLARIGFSSRRKQLHNNLAAGLRLPDTNIRKSIENAGFDPMIRAQELGVKDWVKITKELLRI